jgi:hypothetical protein
VTCCAAWACNRRALSAVWGSKSACWRAGRVKRQFGVMASNGVAQAWLAECLADLLDEAGLDPEFGF